MEQLTDRIFLETTYPGVNVGAILVEQGVVCVDVPSFPHDARHWLSQLNRLYAGPILYVILTDGNGDRILNTRWFDAPLICHQYVADRLRSYEKRYPQTILESLGQRFPGRAKELSNHPVTRASMSFSNKMNLIDGDLTISLRAMPGPSRGNIWVGLESQKAWFVGDSVISDAFPALADLSILEWLESLSALETNQNKMNLIVPGRGPGYSAAEVARLRKLLETMLELVTEHVNSGGSADDLANYADDLLSEFETSDVPEDWMRSQIVQGLERINDDLVSEEKPRIKLSADGH